MYSYKIPKRAKRSVKTEIAGTDLKIGSFTLKCIIIAPIIKILNII